MFSEDHPADAMIWSIGQLRSNAELVAADRQDPAEAKMPHLSKRSLTHRRRVSFDALSPNEDTNKKDESLRDFFARAKYHRIASTGQNLTFSEKQAIARDKVYYPLTLDFLFSRKKTTIFSFDNSTDPLNFHTSSTRQPVASNKRTIASCALGRREEGRGLFFNQSRTVSGFQTEGFSFGKGAIF